MPIELRAFGTKCNIGCLYCYQNPLRDSGNGAAVFNMPLVKQKLAELQQPFVMWGGEPLIMPLPQLDEMLRFNYEAYGSNTILTNGVLITQDHINLFKKWNVRIIVSCDGEGELSDARWQQDLEKTREATAATNRNIEWLVSENIPVNLNIQVTACNSTAEKLPAMFNWLRKMDALGITNVRLHILEIDYSKPLEPYALSLQQNVHAFVQYYLFEKELLHLRFDLFEGIKNQLLVNGLNFDCVWGACDPYTTESVTGMDGQGRLNNCGLTDKEGINFQKPSLVGHERNIALYHTPEAYGGCKGCRFFLVCKGQCPGTAMDGDWRNRSGNCGVWKELFTNIETDILREGGTPVSLHPNLAQLEERMVAGWAMGENEEISSLLSMEAVYEP